MAITIRKNKGKYHIVDKKTGEAKASFDTKAEALAYEGKPKERGKISDLWTTSRW